MKTSDKSTISFKRQLLLFIGFLVALSVLFVLYSYSNNDRKPGTAIPDQTDPGISIDQKVFFGSGIAGTGSFEETALVKISNSLYN